MNEPMTLQAAREQVIDALCRRFADDTLSMAQLERRLERARAARTREELRGLLSDLPARPTVPARGDTTVGSPARAGARSGQRVSRHPDPRTRPTRRPAGSEGEVRTSSAVALAVLGGTRRAGKWTPPESMLALAVMGGVELDFRDAVLEPGSVTTITCFAFWGGIDITVPPEVRLDTDGFALLGGFDQSGDAWAEPAEGAPTIRVNGFALMGGVDVKVRERDQGPSRRRPLPRTPHEGRR